jgi:hypothetical protein
LIEVAPSRVESKSRVRADKIASATINLGLGRELEVISGPVAARAGDVVVVRALTDNATYDALELITGRMAKINPGDIIVGVLGHRRALKGFVGDVPEKVQAGDRLHILNLGGVIGRCLGQYHHLSRAIEVEVMGLAAKDGAILNIAHGAIKPLDSLKVSSPLILIAGTCMNSGKTYAATEIIKHLTRSGLRVAAAKLSGIACLRDTLNMQDHGAIKALSFLDCGLPSTVGVKSLAPIAKGLLAELSKFEPDCIVIELGDGIIGGYGVETIFGDAEIMGSVAAIIFCASDFVGAWGGRELLARLGAKITALSGPVTDSPMGRDYVQNELGLPAANAINEGERLAAIVQEALSQMRAVPLGGER